MEDGGRPMGSVFGSPSTYSLDEHGLTNLNVVYWTLPSPALVERILQRREGVLAHLGAVVVRTGHHTGRSPNDKFVVKGGEHDDKIWWGEVNQPLPRDRFERLLARMTAYFQGRDVFVQDTAAGTHPDYTLPIRIVTEYAWHSLFARNLFLRLPASVLAEHIPQFTVLDAPRFHAIPEEDGTNSEAFIIIDFDRRLALIGGTSYAGEIKKTIFTVMNYLLPQRNVLSMHCSANIGREGDVALFFGLSGTGKTTLSSDSSRRLIGDDEHGWADDGVFNLEGGCYAKTIRLSREDEPIIWDATRQFGTVLENVSVDSMTRRVNYDDDSLTENTRAAYPLGALKDSVTEGRAGHPRNVFFLTADAFSVLPPLARLSPDQAMYYFLSGYTAKVAGTEKGLGTEPQVTFSACFGAPFLPLAPSVYARMFGEKIRDHNVQVWLLNTGWSGGPYGVGVRIRLPLTRAMVGSVLDGSLEAVPTRLDPVFNLTIPTRCPGVPEHLLDPRRTWSDSAAYDAQAHQLAERFAANFAVYANEVPSSVRQAGPKATA